MVLLWAPAAPERALVKTINVIVPEVGVPLPVAVRMFGVKRRQVVEWMQHGDLGTPRDYRAYQGQAELWVTPVGLRNIGALLGCNTVVVAKRPTEVPV